MQTNLDINTIIKNANDILRKLGVSLSQITEKIAEKYGIYPTNDGVDDAVDAFRHAYASAVATYLMGEGVAKAVGDYNEDRIVIPTEPEKLDKYQKSRNMDLYNNDIGRAIGSTADSIEEIGQRVAEAIRNGQTINSLTDTRQWTEPTEQPQITIPDLLKHPLGRVSLLAWNPPLALLVAQIEIAIKAIRSIFTAGKTTGSPIILDLDKDGIETTALTSGTYFDLDNNGFAEQTGWASSDDGLLVMDRDADGLIENGTELFGNETLLANGTKAANGFQALAELDTNTDGKIDSTDTAYSQLRIWQDIDEDGYTSEGELKNLSELGIASINTGYTNSTTVDANGNSHKQISTFTWNDGTTNQATDVWFQQDKMFTIANDWVEVPEDIAALPDLQGFGNVYDLHQTMARERLEANGEGLKGLVEQFIAATDITTRNSLINQIIYRWTGVEGINQTSRGLSIDARQLVAMETIFGEKFLQGGSPNPGPGAAEVLKAAYAGLTELVYSQLMAQTHLKDLYNSITYTWDEQTQSVKGNLSAAAVTIQTAITNDYNAGTALLSEFLKTTRTLGAEDMLDVKTFGETLVAFNPSLAETIEIGGRNPIIGTVYGNTLTGAYYSDALIGKEGNDTLNGGGGDDLLDGGTGNDTILGGVGNDTYIYNLGDGSDTINDYDLTVGNIDTVQFGPGITRDDVEFIKEGNSLKVKISGQSASGGDTLTIFHWFNSPDGQYHIERFKFADGTVVTDSEIDSVVYKTYGTSAANTFYGAYVNEEIYGYEGDDVLYGYEGDDLLDGGTGNDTLLGGEGNDTYKFILGSGADTINNVAADNATTTDKVEFGEGITPDDLELVKENSNLKIKINGTSASGGSCEDALILQNWFSGDAYRVEQFKFTDGTVMTPADFDAKGYKMYGTTANNSLTGSNVNDTIFGYEGNDTISAGSGNDILDGGTGNDTLNGGDGSDTYKFGIGYGTDTINDYSADYATTTDTVEFGAGITLTDLELVKESSNLRIKINGTTDSLIIQGWFSGTTSRIEQFKFADGTTLTSTDFDAIGYKMHGTTANDSLTGSDVNDTIDGGLGNDTLTGRLGNDTYIYNLGDGSDTINDYDTTSASGGGNIDTIEFGEGITKDNIEFIKESNNLKVKINGQSASGGDTLTVQSWFAANSYRIEQFKFADGTILTIQDIETTGYKVYGTTGNDMLTGSNAKDIFDGGAGNDTLTGGTGSDTYKFGIGYGFDTIYDYDTTSASGGGNIDTVEFGPGISQQDLQYTKQGNDLKISINGITDTLTIQSWFYSPQTPYRIEQFKFADGTMLTSADIDAAGYKMYGTTTNDSLTGSNAKDEIYGYDGNDNLIGYAGNDSIYGGNGTDTVYGYEGDDTLDGGTGNDTLNGGLGNDTYIYRLGDGADTISDYSTDSATTTDKVEFGAGITPNDVEFIKNNTDLKIKIIGQTDMLTIQNWFYSPQTPYRIEQFKFADGTVLTSTDIDAIGYKMYGTTTNDSLTGSTVNDQINGNEGNDNLNGYTGNDTLIGGTGNDTLVGGLGSDIYKFEIGSGADTINDTATDYATTTDTVQMGVNSLNTIFTKTNNNLTITNNTTTDQITVQNWYSGTSYQTETIQTADGKHLHNTQVAQLIQAMATFCTTNGVTWNQAIEQKPAEVQQVLAQYWSQT